MREEDPYYEWTWESAKYLMDCVNNPKEFRVYHFTKYSGHHGSHCHRFKVYKARNGINGPETGQVNGTFSCVDWSQSDWPESINKHKPEEFKVFRVLAYPWLNEVSID